MAMTIKEVITETAGVIEKIKIPVGEYDEIGRPLAVCLSNLKACLVAIEAIEKKAKEQAEQTEPEASDAQESDQE